MTVSKLIELLGKIPGETRVLVSGYEDGFDDPGVLLLGEFYPDPDGKSWYTGDYLAGDQENGFMAVVIPR